MIAKNILSVRVTRPAPHPSAKRRGGPKQALIDRYFRGAITAGTLRPGDRLPTRAEIERRFRASPTTVQKALQRLIDDGFVTAAGRRGTFVSDRPLHLYRLALAFPSRPGEPGWVRFWTVLREAAQAYARQDGREVAEYTAVEPWAEGGDYPRLLADVSARRLAGVVFAADPWPLEGTPVLQAEWLPRAAFLNAPGRPGVAGVDLGAGGRLFFEKALDLLASRGRRRIGLITVPGISGDRLDCFARGLAERGMVSHPWWVQTAHQSEPRWAAHLVLLMFRAAAGERPDGLIIADDNLVEHACAGLVQAGVRLPDELDVVTHCNFPAVSPSPLPTHRLGYDMRLAFSLCVDLLDRQRRGRKTPRLTTVAPVFESELEEARSRSLLSVG